MAFLPVPQSLVLNTACERLIGWSSPGVRWRCRRNPRISTLACGEGAWRMPRMHFSSRQMRLQRWERTAGAYIYDMRQCHCEQDLNVIGRETCDDWVQFTFLIFAKSDDARRGKSQRSCSSSSASSLSSSGSSSSSRYALWYRLQSLTSAHQRPHGLPTVF